MRSEVKEGEDILSVVSLSILVILYFSCSSTQFPSHSVCAPSLLGLGLDTPHLSQTLISVCCVQVYWWLDQLDVVMCVLRIICKILG